jgi:hypothetical protein
VNLGFSGSSFVISIHKSALNLENNNKNNLSKNIYNIVNSPKNELKSNDETVPSEDKPTESSLKEKYNNKLIPNKDITSLTYLAFKVKNEYYQIILFDNIYKNYPKREEILPYLSFIFIEIQKILIDCENKFDTQFSEDINRLMENNTFPRCPESKVYI